MRKIVLFFVAVLMLSACQQTLEERAAREAQVYTDKNCPAQLGEYLVMDSMTFDVQTHTFCYDYRFMGLMDTTAHDTEEMYRQLHDALKNTTTLKVYKDAGYNFRYVYRSQKHPDTIIFEATFGKEDY